MNKNVFTFIFFALVFFAAAGAMFSFFKDASQPEISFSPDGGSIAANTPITIQIKDKDSPIQRAEVVCLFADQRFVLVDRNPFGPNDEKIILNLQDVIQNAGEVTIEVTATDSGRLGIGNTHRVFKQFTIESAPLE